MKKAPVLEQIPLQIKTLWIKTSTDGAGDFIDLTEELSNKLRSTGLQEGIVTVSVVGSTAGIVTFEYEPGLIKDLREIYEKMAPKGKNYFHHQTWGDDNGSSHIRSALQGTSMTIPFYGGKLLLGTWQQVVLAEFDTRPRERKIVVQFIGK